MMTKWVFAFFSFFFFSVIFSSCVGALPEEPLVENVAFQFSATAKDNQTILGIWDIKPGYYLYRDRIHFASLRPTEPLGQPLWPKPDGMKDFPGIGKLAVYTHHLEISVPVLNTPPAQLFVKVSYQGCSESGFCYPPTSKIVQINLAGNYRHPAKPLSIDLATDLAAPLSPPILTMPEHTQAYLLLAHQHFFTALFGFFIFGLLLSLTPCVLPMIPILSSIIVGQKALARRAFGLSVAYVLGMAITYAGIGILFSWIGSTISATLQKPWIIVLFSIIFVAMALSLFGLYDITLPGQWQKKVSDLSQRQKSETYFGVAIMGVLSTLILSPCVTPPLVAVLSYVGQSGNVGLGGVALFMMGIGMGVPLLLIGAFSKRLLPKAGSWMVRIKQGLGVLMLAVALLLLSRILPGPISLGAWGVLALGTGIACGALATAHTRRQKILKGFGLLLFIYGIVLVVGATTGHSDPFRPVSLTPQASFSRQFIPVKTIQAVQTEILKARNTHQPVLLDFYADWCLSCQVMEHGVFQNPDVQKALQHYQLLRADISKNTLDDQALERYYRVIAPPTILFFNTQGEELPNRLIGEVSARQFLAHLRALATQ